MTNMSRFLRWEGLAVFGAMAVSALACSAPLQKPGVDADSLGGGSGGSGSGGGGSGGSGDGGDGGLVDAGCPAPTLISGSGHTRDDVPPCHAPPTANGAWTAEAGWSEERYQDISMSGDRLVLVSFSGLDARRTDAGWTAGFIISFSDPVLVWAAVDGETLAMQTQFFQNFQLSIVSIGGWNGVDSAPNHALSGTTLVTTDRVFVKAAVTWGPSTLVHPDAEGTAKVVALGDDRFALLRAAETRIVQRQDATWKELGTLPAAKSVGMPPAGTSVPWLVLSAKETMAGTSPVGVYTLTGTDWQRQATVGAPADVVSGFGTDVSVSQPHPGAASDPSIIVVSGGPTTITYLRDGTGAVREQDRLPIQGQAVASGSNLAILSTNPIVAGTTALSSPAFVYRATF